jgi:hypothetical protein
MAWLTLASTSPIASPKPDSQRGNHRIHTTLKALHHFTRSLWLSRNDVLHKQQESILSVRYSAESSEIRHYFANPLLLPAEDRHHCSSNLDQLLRSRPSVRRRWLRRVRTARANMLKHGQLQTTIYNFFRHPNGRTPRFNHDLLTNLQYTKHYFPASLHSQHSSRQSNGYQEDLRTMTT